MIRKHGLIQHYTEKQKHKTLKIPQMSSCSLLGMMKRAKMKAVMTKNCNFSLCMAARLVIYLYVQQVVFCLAHKIYSVFLLLLIGFGLTLKR